MTSWRTRDHCVFGLIDVLTDNHFNRCNTTLPYHLGPKHSCLLPNLGIGGKGGS